MILLELESRIVRTLLERSLDETEKLSGDYTFCDFDGVRWHLSTGGKGQVGIKIQIFIPCMKDLLDHGAGEHIESLYAAYKIPPEPALGIPFQYAIQFDLKTASEEERKNIITLASRLKSNFCAAPILWAGRQAAAKTNFAAFEIAARPQTGEAWYVAPADQGMTVTFRIRFSDPGDKIIAGVFFQELQAGRARVGSAPSVAFKDEAPSELEGFASVKEGNPGDYAFVTFSLLAPQLSDRKLGDVALNVPLFRNYLHYHIKCTKGYLHQRMRARVQGMLKVLQDATPEPKVKVLRGVSGKVINPPPK